jgi:D-3-phosphoglycerate dehydrogenase
MLEEAGFIVSYQPGIKASEVSKALRGFQVLIVRSKLFINSEVLAEAADLKVIARAGAGIDNIDEKVLEEKNIKLINAPEGNRDAVGEFTLGLLLALFRNIVKADKEVRNLEWYREPNRGEEISGKTIAIIGYGNMGRAFAKCLQSFGCTVLACDADPDCCHDNCARPATFEEVFEQADVVSFHIPYIPANYHFADLAFIEKFRKPIWVLNTARGEVMDYNAIVSGLKSGLIKGAALDVLENEKLSTLSPIQQQNFTFLSQASNVILTPHIAGWSHQSYFKINEILVQKLKTLLF